MLFIEFFLVENNVAINKKVVEKEKLAGFWLFGGQFGKQLSGQFGGQFSG